jgi:DNA-binding LytR/AlgR family response regulator
LHFVASANNYDDGLNLILEHHPKIVFLEIDPTDKDSNLSLHLINELYRYLRVMPKIIITTKKMDLAFEAIKYEVFDYFTKPLDFNQFRKTILKFERAMTEVPQFFAEPAIATDPILKASQEIIQASIADSIAVESKIEETQERVSEVEEFSETPIADTPVFIEERLIQNTPFIIQNQPEIKPLIICVKSYGDYRFIEAKDICYLQADNNSTDIHLYNGEMITAFKTLKHFEGVLTSPFVRIHNSYIVNIDFVSRIHTGNAVCYIKNTTTKLPFSKSYKENVDSIINSITNGNYLEI